MIPNYKIKKDEKTHDQVVCVPWGSPIYVILRKLLISLISFEVFTTYLFTNTVVSFESIRYLYLKQYQELVRKMTMTVVFRVLVYKHYFVLCFHASPVFV